MSRQLVIAGMHRSGTSLLASIAARAGVDMGSSLMGESKGNRHGHFEDLELVHLQEKWLESRGWSALVPPGETPQLTPAEEDEACAFVARRADKPLWGCKDPRTSLFLPVWDRLLPDPVYLLVYRHPVEVVLSLLRRGLDVEVQLNPWVAVQAWTLYNSHLLRFRLAHPDRCLLWHVEGATRSLERAFAALAGRFGLTLAPGVAAGAFAPEDLTGGLSARGIDWRAVLPEAMDLYGRLQAAADLPGGDGAAAPERAGRSRLERDLLEAAEHLLAATLSATSPAAGAQVPAAWRVDYSDLRLHMARQEEEIQRLAAAARESDSRAGQLEQQVTLQDLEIRRLLEEAERTEERLRSASKEARTLGERLQSREEEWGRIQATRGWKLLHAWWSARARRRPRRVSAGPEAGDDGDGHPRVDEVVIGCVAENNPRFQGEALRLVQSIRWFGGAMAGVKVLVCFVDGVDAEARRNLERYGAEVRVVPRFDRRNPSANKLQLFPEALATGARFLILLDCDMLVTRDLLPLLDRGTMQSKAGDVPSVTHEAFVPLFRHFGLPLPPRSMRTTLLDTPTIPYCNTAMVALPADLARRFVPVWSDYNRRILDTLELLGPCAHHCHQASFSLALAACPVPFRESPVELNFPLHLTHLEPPPEFLAADPAILHYHDRIDADGCVHPSPYPLAQARIELWNERLRREAGIELAGAADPAAVR